MLSIFLLVGLLPRFVISAGVDVYLYPTPPPSSYSVQQVGGVDPVAAVAHHLQLEAFFPLPTAGGAAEKVLGGGGGAFVGEGARDALVLAIDVSRAQDVVPDVGDHPSYRLAMSSDALCERYMGVAPMGYRTVIDGAAAASASGGLPVTDYRILDVFSAASPLSSSVVQEFMKELGALAAFVDKSDGVAAAAGDRFGRFRVTGLVEIERGWGRDSEIYRTAISSLKAVIQSASSRAISVAVVVSREGEQQLDARQPPPPEETPLPEDVPATAPVFSTSTCFANAGACQNATAGCSSRGQCVAAKRAGRTCFVCACGRGPEKEGGKDVSWAGAMCEKKDISTEVGLLAGTVLFLVVVAGGGIGLLWGIGDGELPGTLRAGAVVQPKQE